MSFDFGGGRDISVTLCDSVEVLLLAVVFKSVWAGRRFAVGVKGRVRS